LTPSAERVKVIFATSCSVIAVAGMPWLKVAVISVVVYDETTPSEDLMVTLAV
jgi:hypothetical protein